MNGRPDLSRLAARLAKFRLPALILCLDDNMWVGRLNGSYATLRPSSGRVELLPADRFGAAFGISES